MIGWHSSRELLSRHLKCLVPSNPSAKSRQNFLPVIKISVKICHGRITNSCTATVATVTVRQEKQQAAGRFRNLTSLLVHAETVTALSELTFCYPGKFINSRSDRMKSITWQCTLGVFRSREVAMKDQFGRHQSGRTLKELESSRRKLQKNLHEKGFD